MLVPRLANYPTSPCFVSTARPKRFHRYRRSPSACRIKSRPVLIHGAEADYRSYGQQVPGEMAGSNIPRGWRQIDPQDLARGFTVAAGFSGSPVLDDLGNVVWGMIVAVAEQGTGVAYAIPAENLWAALRLAGAGTTVRVVAGAAMPLGIEPNNPSVPPDLPELPAQGPGPHFEITRAGVIDFVPPEALDREGNNVGRLRQLHPTLRDLVRKLLEALRTGNAPHAYLAVRLDEYRKQIDQALETIDFTLLYVEGVRLANAEKAAVEKVEEGELPPLGEANEERLGTILQLHGTFMLSTIAGAELIAAEQRYRRRPAEERGYRAAAVDLAASLQNKPDVIAANAAAFVLGAAEQINQGPNLERSGVIATSVVLNVAITLAAAAIVTALPVVGGLFGGSPGLVAGGLTGFMVSESVKRSKPFATAISPVIAKLDEAADLRKFRDFLLSIELKARRLAQYNEQFLWLNKALNWITSSNLPFNLDLLRKVDELSVSKEVIVLLKRDNIVYVGDLAQKTVAEIMQFPGCTRGMVNEISESLASIGLHLGMDLQGWPLENIQDLEKELKSRT